MKNKKIRWLIFSISIALIGLVAMQFYWVNSSIVLKNEEFSRNIGRILHSVSNYLTLYEEASLTRVNSQESYLFIDDNAEEKILLSSVDTNYDYLMKESYVQNGEQIDIHTSEESGGVIISDSKERNVRHLPAFNQMDTEDQGWTFGSSGARPYRGISLNKEFRMRIEHKNTFIGQIGKSLRRVNSSEQLEKRIDSAFLDSLLHVGLLERGIDSDFEFGVFDGDGVYRFGNRDMASEALLASTYKSRLFINDLFYKPGYLQIYFPQMNRLVFRSSFGILLTSVFIVFVIIYIFFWTVKAIIIQEINSEIKNDFINNMTHELKTPISTISLAVEVLKDPIMAGEAQLLPRYLVMIDEENKRLGMLVEEVLQSAALDRQAFKIKNDRVDVYRMIHDVINKMEITINDNHGRVTLDMNPDMNYFVNGDLVHLTNMMYNLVGNAIKYSVDKPVIHISLRNTDQFIIIRVSDKGIGIEKAHLKKIFDKLYRVPTGNLHDVKGFGLGLNYVKTIVNRHSGTIDVCSKIGKGSVFIVRIPKEIKSTFKAN